MRGRKKKSYRTERKTFYCTNPQAWDICRQKGIILSEEITNFITFLASSNNMGLDQKEKWALNIINIHRASMKKELEDVERKWKIQLAQDNDFLTKVRKAIAKKEISAL